MYCIVQNCRSVWIPNSSTRFHSFPKDDEKRNTWLLFIPIKGKFYASAKICSLHFRPDDYDPDRPGRLLSSAVPFYIPESHDCDSTLSKKQYSKIVMHRQCCVSSCTSKQDTVLMHKMPRSSDRQRLWLDIIDNRKLDNLRDLQYCCLKVCEKHFERRFKNGLRLRYGAYPTLFTPEEISKGVPDRTINDDTCSSDHTHIKDQEHNDHSCIKVGRSGTSGTEKRYIPSTDQDGGTVSHDVPVADDDPEDEAEDSRKLAKTVFSWEAKELIIEADDSDVPESHQEVSAPAVLDRDLTETSLYQEDDPYVSEDNSGYDHSYVCDECGGSIMGFRYTCVQCEDWDLCGACEARAAHAAHYVLRIPSARPYKEIQAALATIRQHLLSENHFKMERAHSVKLEPVEPQERQQPPRPEREPPADWEAEFLDIPDIEEAPEVVEDGAPPAKRRRPSPRAATHNTINPTMPDSPSPDCSNPILQRLLTQTKKRKIRHKTRTRLSKPKSSQSEDKLAPPRTDPSPKTIELPAPAAANIKRPKKILVRIPARIDPAEVVKMLNPPVSVKLKSIKGSNGTEEAVNKDR